MKFEYQDQPLSVEQSAFLKYAYEYSNCNGNDPCNAVAVANALGWQKSYNEIEDFLVSLAISGVAYNIRRIDGVPHFALLGVLCERD